jgi:hypothetical protein
MSFEENIFSTKKGRSNKLNNHTCQLRNITLYDIAQGDQKVSVHLIITAPKTRKYILDSFNYLP